jgi:hypothetical protein
MSRDVVSRQKMDMRHVPYASIITIITFHPHPHYKQNKTAQQANHGQVAVAS